jgi:4-amino-4-deoxy-L-arabinose transferase-like glycosyltransferase
MDGAAPRSLLRRRGAAVAFLALAFVFAWPMQVNGWNQNAHYALVRALADGKPWIDESRHEIGDLGTGDVAEYRGHTYAAKGPGLAFVSLPAFAAVEATGMRTTGDPTRVIWALHLWGAALAGLVTLLLVRRLGDRLEPGLGIAAAIVAGLGTLLLPFATLYFSHVLAALFGFAAFAVLWREREGPPRLALVAAAGALAGLGVTTEHPLVFVGLVLGLYALRRDGLVRRGLAYAGGVLAGLAPLLAYNWWAFGSPTHFAYHDNLTSEQVDPGAGFFGFGVPSLHVTGELLFSSMGLLTLTPVLACGAAGLVVIARRGRRPEALAIAGVVVAYLLYNSSLRYFSPFGGLGPPRYLLTLVPFAAVALATAFRAFPLTTLALGAVSAFQMVVMTATGPLAAYDGEWLERLVRRDVVQTTASLVDVTGWYTIVPFFLAALVAVTAAAGTHITVARRELPIALAALLGWSLVAATAASPNGAPPADGYVFVLVGLLGALSLALSHLAGAGPGVLELARGRRRALS